MVAFSSIWSLRRGYEGIPVAAEATATAAISMAAAKSRACASLWRYSLDPISTMLLRYACERAMLGRLEYVWDALSRRAMIACRHGAVHGATVDLTGVLE